MRDKGDYCPWPKCGIRNTNQNREKVNSPLKNGSRNRLKIKFILVFVFFFVGLISIFLFAPIITIQFPNNPSLGLIRAPRYQVSPSFFYLGFGEINAEYCGWHPYFALSGSNMSCGALVQPVNPSTIVHNSTYVSSSETVVVSVTTGSTSVSTSISVSYSVTTVTSTG